jgi:hypothetical protein
VTGDEQRADYRQGELLPEDAVLVRGGPLVCKRLRSAAKVQFKRGHGFYGLSMFSFPGKSDPEEIFECSSLQYPDIYVCTAWEIREAGFEVKRTFETFGHCSLIFPSAPSVEDIRTVIELLEPYTIGGE